MIRLLRRVVVAPLLVLLTVVMVVAFPDSPVGPAPRARQLLVAALRPNQRLCSRLPLPWVK